jgi:hypothetical protein
MRREDYERRGPTAKACPPKRIDYLRATERGVGGIETENGDMVMLALIAKRSVGELNVVSVLDKQETDDLIRDLIAARNTVWPTP